MYFCLQAELRYNDLMTEREKVSQISLELNASKNEKKIWEGKEKTYLAQISEFKAVDDQMKNKHKTVAGSSSGFYESMGSGAEHSDDYKKTKKPAMPKKRGFWNRAKRDESRARKTGVVGEVCEYQSVEYLSEAEYPTYPSSPSLSYDQSS